MTNREWSEKVLKLLDPSYKHRWEIFEKHLRSYLGRNTIWVDLGCGTNADIEEKRELASYAFGIDIVRSDTILSRPIVIADITSLPLKSHTIDIISLRFVVEHISNPESLFTEIHRVLRSNGGVILITTNIWSPVIFIPKILPYALRKLVIKKLFKVYDDDIFPTFHRFNSYLKMGRELTTFKLTKLEFIQDLNYTSKTIFIIFLLWHLFTKLSFFRIFRTNIMAIYKKVN